MPCSAEFFQQLVHWENVAYHRTDAENLTQILTDGLVPWNQHGYGSQDDLELCPRPDHVYFGLSDFSILEHELSLTQAKAGEVHPFYNVLAVDISGFNPELINPDEDAFWQHGDWDAKHPVCRHAPVPVFMYDDLDCEQGYHSFGDWAEGIQLGSDPDHTTCGIQTSKTFAYRGVVAPHLLTAHECFVAVSPTGELYWDHRPMTVAC